MSVQELFTMLTVKNSRLDCFGIGKVSLVAEDISAAIGMAGIPRSHYCLMRV